MSELAEIRARINQEVEAMNLALNGYAVTAKHDMINNRYATLATYQQELTPHLGEQGALEVIINALDNLDTPKSAPQV